MSLGRERKERCKKCSRRVLGVEAGRFIYPHTPGRHSGGLLGVEAGRFIYQHTPGRHSGGLLGVEAGRLIYQLIPDIHITWSTFKTGYISA